MNSDEKKVMALRREEGSVCEVSVGRRRTEHVFFLIRFWHLCCIYRAKIKRKSGVWEEIGDLRFVCVGVLHEGWLVLFIEHWKETIVARKKYLGLGLYKGIF